MLYFWLCHSMWLFYLYCTVTIRLFYLVFPLAESMAKAFCRLFLWNFKERLCHSMWLSYLHSTVEMQLFSPNFPLAESITEEFCWLFLCNFKEKSINHFLWHSL